MGRERERGERRKERERRESTERHTHGKGREGGRKIQIGGGTLGLDSGIILTYAFIVSTVTSTPGARNERENTRLLYE
jgi:hypothetical protein